MLQIDPYFLPLIVQAVARFFLSFLVVFVAFYFASQIVTEEGFTFRQSFIIVIISVVMKEISWWIMYFSIPIPINFIALIVAMIVLLALLGLYQKMGIFSALALTMLALVCYFIIDVVVTTLLFIFFVPIPF